MTIQEAKKQAQEINIEVKKIDNFAEKMGWRKTNTIIDHTLVDDMIKERK